MARPDAWMPIYWADFWTDTRALNAVEQCAYFNLLGAAWMAGGSLPDDNDRLQRLSKVTEKEWRASSATVTAYFERVDGRLYQARLTKEYAKAMKAYTGRSEHIATVNRNRKRSKPTVTVPVTATGKPPDNASTTHNSQSPDGESSFANAHDGAEDAPLKARIFGPCLDWLAKASQKNPKQLRSLVGKWCSEHGDGATLEAINAAAKNSPIDPIPYIDRVLSGGGKSGPNRPNARDVTDVITRLKVQAERAESVSGDRWDGYGAGGLSPTGDDGRTAPAGSGTDPGVIDAADAEHLYRAAGRTEVDDGEPGRAGQRPVSSDPALHADDSGISGRRNPPRPDHAGETVEVVAGVAGAGGAAGTSQPATAPALGGATGNADGQDVPDLLAKARRGRDELLARALGDGPAARKTRGVIP